MLTGFFGVLSGRPYIEGRVILPRLGLGAGVTFLIDTGADTSILNPADARELGVDFGHLSNRSEAVGTAGVAVSYVEPASIVFTDPGRRIYVYQIDLDIADPVAGVEGLPSLLGRDVVDRMRMVYEPAKGTLTMTPRSADIALSLR